MLPRREQSNIETRGSGAPNGNSILSLGISRGWRISGRKLLFLGKHFDINISIGILRKIVAMTMQAVAKFSGDNKAAAVLTKAVMRAAANLGINQASLAQILGVSATTVSRMADANYALAEHRKEWELGALFVRMYRSLDAIAGDQAGAWLANENRALSDKPINLIRSAQGLVRVVEYLDASRARL